MYTHNHNPYIYPRPSMTAETRAALTELAREDGYPHFLLTWEYEAHRTKSERLIDVRVGTINPIDSLPNKTFSLHTALSHYPIDILAKARLLMEIDPLIKEHVHWVQQRYNFPYRETPSNIMMQVVPGIIRLSDAQPDLNVYATLNDITDGNLETSRLHTLSAFFIPEAQSAHETIANLTLLDDNTHYWQQDFDAIHSRTGPEGSRLIIGSYKDIP